MSVRLAHRLVMLTAVLQLVAMPAEAAFYKWHDAEGQVHYSHLRPQGGATLAVEVFDAGKLRGVRMRPHSEDGVYYCGTFALPQSNSDAMGAIFRLRQSIDRWQSEIERASTSIESEEQRRAVELRCAIDYAHQELQRLEEIEEVAVEELQAINAKREALQQELQQCRAAGAGNDCYSRYQSRIEQLEAIRRVLEKRMRQMEQGR